jgi:hypothetical protein
MHAAIFQIIKKYSSLKTEFLLRYNNSVCTSQETHYISTTNISRLMLFRETNAAYCRNCMKHTNILFRQNRGVLHVKADRRIS